MPPMGDSAEPTAEAGAGAEQATLTAATDQNGTDTGAQQDGAVDQPQAEDPAPQRAQTELEIAAAEQVAKGSETPVYDALKAQLLQAVHEELAAFIAGPAFAGLGEQLKSLGDRLAAVEAPGQQDAIEKHMDEVVETFTAEVKAAMAELTGDVRSQFEALVERVATLEGAPKAAASEADPHTARPDATTISVDVSAMQPVLDAISAIAARLTKLEMQLRHTL